MKTTTKKKSGIGVLGIAINSGNLGVDALGRGLVTLLRRGGSDGVELFSIARPGGEFVVRDQRGDSKVTINRCRLSLKSGLASNLLVLLSVAVVVKALPGKLGSRLAGNFEWLSAIDSCDFVGDIRGGDSFSDIYGMRRFLIGFLQSWIVILIKGSIVQFPQTYGPFKSPLARLLAQYILRRSSLVVARDTKSQRIAQELIGSSRKVLLSPDVAFALVPIYPGALELSPPRKLNENSEVVGINVNGLMYNGGYTRKNMFELRLDYRGFIVGLIERLFQEGVREVWLIPHTFAPPGHVESDNESCDRVRAALSPAARERVSVLIGQYDCQEIKSVIGRCGFFVGARMHSCIAALSQGVPCVGVAYSMKFQGVFDSVAMGDWVVDARRVTKDDAIADVIRLYRERSAIRKQLLNEADQACRRLSEVFEKVVASGTRHEHAPVEVGCLKKPAASVES